MVDEYAPELFTASSQEADVGIEWSAWFAVDRMAVSTLPWERMSWLVYMPRAVVSGRPAVDGQVYVVTASGYHDHNWGEWAFTNAPWNWAQCSARGLSFELGDFVGGPAGCPPWTWKGSGRCSPRTSMGWSTRAR